MLSIQSVKLSMSAGLSPLTVRVTHAHCGGTSYIALQRWALSEYWLKANRSEIEKLIH